MATRTTPGLATDAPADGASVGPLRNVTAAVCLSAARSRLCAESACGPAFHHNVVGPVVLPRVTIVVDGTVSLEKSPSGRSIRRLTTHREDPAGPTRSRDRRPVAQHPLASAPNLKAVDKDLARGRRVHPVTIYTDTPDSPSGNVTRRVNTRSTPCRFV